MKYEEIEFCVPRWENNVGNILTTIIGTGCDTQHMPVISTEAFGKTMSVTFVNCCSVECRMKTSASRRYA